MPSESLLSRKRGNRVERVPLRTCAKSWCRMRLNLKAEESIEATYRATLRPAAKSRVTKPATEAIPSASLASVYGSYDKNADSLVRSLPLIVFLPCSTQFDPVIKR